MRIINFEATRLLNFNKIAQVGMIRINFITCLFSFLFIINLHSQDTITVEKIWKDYEYLAKRVPGFNFMNDGQHYTRLERNVIKKYDLLTGKSAGNVLEASALTGKGGFEGKIGSYGFTEDEKVIIIESDSEPIYRRSSKANFFIYNRDTEELTSVYEDDKVQYASLSPDGTKVAYVWNNNIYYKNLEDGVTLSLIHI